MSRILYLTIALFLLINQSTNSQSTNHPSTKTYLFSYFKGNGEDGLHLAYSKDGYNWNALRGDSSFLKPTVSKDKLMRDPCIIRGADGLFHMVWTVSWNDRGIGYASSKDLVHWSEQQYVPVMQHEPDARNCWAPEIFYDARKKEYMIYWATTITGRFSKGDTAGDDKYNHRMYYTLTKDFKTFSPTKLLYDKDFNVIDATIQSNGKGYIMFLKDETRKPAQKNLRTATSKTLTGDYSAPSEPITGKYWAEGPTVIKIGDNWIVYFDKYTEHKYGAVSSTDLKTWTDISDKVSFPKGLRHGTVLAITEKELEQLAATHTKPTDGLPAVVLNWAKKTGARKKPTSTKLYLVNKYGAVNDGKTLSTAFIQKAIDDCAAKGGGIVGFMPGEYVTGSIFLKSNVHLQINKGVTLLGSQSFDDYPEIDTRIAGIEMKWPAALINVIGQQNVMVSGEGKVNARGKFCWDKYWTMRREEYEPKGLRWIVDYDAKRVRTFLVQESADVTLKGVTFSNAGFWTVQLLYSKYITVDGIIVRNNEDGKGPSTDGVDVDSSSWVLVENCDIDCNDDDFCLKAGRDWDGLRVNRPTEYVVIRNCIARKGGGLLTLGSETSGGIRHVLATNLTGMGTGNGFHIKSATTRGGTVEDIYFHNVTLDSVGNAFQFTMNWNPTYSYSSLPAGYNYDSIPAHWKTMLQKVEPAERGIPHFKNIYVSGIKAKGVKRLITAAGLPQSTLQNFQFRDINIEANTAGEISFADGWKFEKTTITTKDKAPLQIKESKAIPVLITQ